MYCTTCGTQLSNPAIQFCTNCGTPANGVRKVERLSFHGDGKTLFVLSLKWFLLTVITLGVYGFWARAQKRQYMYSQTELAGERFQFHGTGLELFIGGLKVLAVLAVFIAQAIAWPILLDPEIGGIVAAVVLYAGIFALLPLAIVGSWRYRLSRSSYRGIRFSFRGTAGEAYREFFLSGLLLIVTLGIYTPFFLTRLRRFLTRHTYYGNEPFAFDADGGHLLVPYILSILLTLPTLWISGVWFKCKTQMYFLSRTTFERARFEVYGTPGEWTANLLLSYVFTFFTLGIASPWATVMRTRFVLDHTALSGAPDFAGIRQRAMAASATGEALSEFLDTGLGIEL